MSHASPSVAGPVPSLVGMLSVFDVSRVLSWLAAGSQTGELRIEGRDIEGRIWLMQGELSNAQVGKAKTIGQAVFELARIDDGTFQFTDGPVSSSGEPPVAVAAVLTEVSANVEEWRAIRRVVPVAATVALCPDAPDHDVKIRSDQWRLLIGIGTGDKTVEHVIESANCDQLAALRALRDLHVAGLITIDAPVEPVLTAAPRRDPASSVQPPATLTAQRQPDGSTPPSGQTPVDMAAGTVVSEPTTTIISPPPGTDPWATLADANATSDNGVT